MTKEKPILFKIDMVAGVLDELKTHTRRLRGLEKLNENPNAYHLFSQTPDIDGKFLFCANRNEGDLYIKCPYGKKGDRLWVRETWAAPEPYDDIKPSLLERENDEYSQLHISYKTHDREPNYAFRGKWRPSIFMPRWANRIILEVIGIRVEQIQNIKAKDCIVEGILPENGAWHDYRNGRLKQWCLSDPRDSFRTLWDSINEKRGFGFDVNPWVWVVVFKLLNIKTDKQK